MEADAFAARRVVENVAAEAVTVDRCAAARYACLAVIDLMFMMNGRLEDRREMWFQHFSKGGSAENAEVFVNARILRDIHVGDSMKRPL